jgi:hypothetical protein
MKHRLTIAQRIIGRTLIKAVALERKRFERHCRNVESIQEKVLLDLIKKNRSTAFGKAHGFSDIRRIEDFRRALPVSPYEYFRPYIEKVVAGDERALFGAGEKILLFAMTSGTGGRPKYIPVTRTFLKRYHKGWRLWGSYVLRKYPLFLARKIVQLASPMGETRTARGIPCGGISGLTADMPSGVIRSNYALPSAMIKVQDIHLQFYIDMRIAVPQDVGFILTSNAGSILRHVQTADGRKEDIIRDIADGTCDGIEKLDESTREALRPSITKDEAEARRLERIVNETGHLYAKDYWPDIDLVGCWKSGPMQTYVDRLRPFFGDATIWDLGIIASEGRMTIPMDDGPGEGPLDIENCFFEFIPEESGDEQSPPVLLPTELEVGKKYFIIMTTCAGLYRYNISDVVEVTDFFHRNPVIRYINKGSHFSNITGEKISEFQVVSAMRSAAQELGLAVEDFCLAAHNESVPYYSIIIERDKVKSDEIAQRCVQNFDDALGAMNIDYQRRRRDNVLGPPRVQAIPEGSFKKLQQQALRERRVGGGVYKHKYLVSNEEFLRQFAELEEKLIKA